VTCVFVCTCVRVSWEKYAVYITLVSISDRYSTFRIAQARKLVSDQLIYILLLQHPSYTAPQLLHYTALHCTALHCTALHCTVLYCTALHCTALHCTVLYCTALHCTALHCTALYCTVLYCTVLHCTALYCNIKTYCVMWFIHGRMSVRTAVTYNALYSIRTRADPAPTF
jgi:hypothetical protein